MNVDLFCRGPRGFDQQILSARGLRCEARHVIAFHPRRREASNATSVEGRKLSIEAEGDSLSRAEWQFHIVDFNGGKHLGQPITNVSQLAVTRFELPPQFRGIFSPHIAGAGELNSAVSFHACVDGASRVIVAG